MKKKRVSADKEVEDDLLAPDEKPVKQKVAADNSADKQEEAPASDTEIPVDARNKATASREALLNQLRVDIKAGKDAIFTAGDAAKADLKLIKRAASDEIAVLKERISGALNQEGTLLNIGRRKMKQALSDGEDWGKKQLSNLRSAADRLRDRIKK